MLTPDQIEQLDENGFLVVPGVLDPSADLDPILLEYEGVLDRLATDLYRQGSLSSRFADLSFSQRLIQVMRETGDSQSQHFDFSLPKGNIRPSTPMWLGEAVFSAITNNRILDCVESVIGSEIYSNPVQHVRLKPPEDQVPLDAKGKSVLVGKTPWHQDNGVLTPDADATEMLTVWFPLTEATIENGCLVVLPGSHRDELSQHCADSNAQLSIPEVLIDATNAVPVPVGRGSILMFHRKLKHASLENRSQDIRASFDLRYQPVGQPSGRAMFPGFVARSRQSPETVLKERERWAAMWMAAKQQLVGAEKDFDRWKEGGPLCA